MNPSTSQHDRRVLLIGWDSIDRPLIDSLVAQGSMPAVASMLSEGVLGKLAPVQPLVSPMLWTSLATGARADKHGVLGFYDPEPTAGRLRRVSSEDRRCKAIWNWTSEAGLPTHVVGWPATSPSESVLGVMVSDACFDRADVSSWFAQRFPSQPWGPEADTQFVQAVRSVTNWSPTPAYAERRSALLESVAADRRATELLKALLRKLDAVHAVACSTVEHLPWAFSAICYPTVAGWFDSIAGQGCPPQPAERRFRAAAWRLQDAMLGELRQLAGPDSTVVLAGPQAACPSIEAAPGSTASASSERMGLVGLTGPGVTMGAPLVGATVLDVAATIGRLLGVSIDADHDGRALPVVQRGRRRTNPADANSRPAAPVASPQATQLDPLADGSIPADDALCRQVRLNHRVNLALALTDSNRIDQAIDLWRGLHDDAPDEPLYATKLVDCLLRCERHDECLEAIERLPAAIGRHEGVRLAHARITHARGDAPGAAEIASELAARPDATPKLLLNAANLLLDCDADDQAIAAFRRCLTLGGDNPIPLSGLASALWNAERHEESVDAAQAALAIAPAYTEARFRLALALRGCGRDDEAIRQFEQCLQEGWLPDDTHLQLASLYWGKDPARASHHRAMSGVV